MNYDKEKVDEVTLALIWLVTQTDKSESRAWKTFDWITLDRHNEKGLISDPKRKNKFVALSEEAVELSEAYYTLRNEGKICAKLLFLGCISIWIKNNRKMAFSELELKMIDKIVGGLCRELNRPEFKDELSIEYRIDRQDLVIFEKRPAFKQPNETTEIPAAKLKYFRTKNEWQLFWMRGDLKWHAYKPIPKSGGLSDLVAEVKSDPYGCFWG